MRLASKPNQLAILALVCALLATHYCSGDQTSGQPEAGVLGGAQVEPGKYPFMASIQIRETNDQGWFHVCGGTVLDQEHILTAASCVVERPVRNIQVRLGCDMLSECESVGSIYNVSMVMIHSGFGLSPRKKFRINNVAIVKLASKIRFGRVKGPGAVGRVRLADTPETCCDEGRKRLQAVGWGDFRNFGHLSDSLSEAELGSINLGDCNTKWKDSTNKNMICSGDATSNACALNLGGPLLLVSKNKDPIQVGILSGVDLDDCGGKPSIAMKVASFRKWIDERVNTLS